VEPALTVGFHIGEWRAPPPHWPHQAPAQLQRLDDGNPVAIKDGEKLWWNCEIEEHPSSISPRWESLELHPHPARGRTGGEQPPADRDAHHQEQQTQFPRIHQVFTAHDRLAPNTIPASGSGWVHVHHPSSSMNSE